MRSTSLLPFSPAACFVRLLFSWREEPQNSINTKSTHSLPSISPRKHDNKQILFRFNNILINSHKCCGDLLTRRQNYVLVLLTL